MKREVLEALVERWRKDSKTPECQNGPPEAEIGNAKADGFRKGLMTCADDLESLIQILEDQQDNWTMVNADVKRLQKMCSDFIKED